MERTFGSSSTKIHAAAVTLFLSAWVLFSLPFETQADLSKALPSFTVDTSAALSQIPGFGVGAQTKTLVHDLGNKGMYATAVGEVTRGFFSVPGQLITLEGDNVSVFEYPDEETAQSEALAFQQSAQTPDYAWRKQVTLHVQDTLVVFYHGKQKEIRSVLTELLGEPLVL